MTIEQDVRTPTRDGQADFDFLMGTWRLRHRRLRRPRVDLDAWETFEGTAVVQPVWGGRANIEELHADAPSGPIHGVTLRLYDPGARQWRLYWANRDVGVLDRPTVGEFRDGRGEFFDQDTIDGRVALIRFVWSDITDTSCRWEQAFSWDRAATWTVDWVMEFTRSAS